MNTTTVDIKIADAPIGLLRLIACKVLLLEAKRNRGALPEDCLEGLDSVIALLEEACASLAPCAAEYALGVVAGAAAVGELGRLTVAPGPTLVERVREVACPRCAAALRGEASSAQCHDGVVH
ncbi:MAG TPA: hypothetical protein VN033_08850 [Vulgatibacter sp.]|nr:hypothetical protein [Vulgatibacter sp.]